MSQCENCNKPIKQSEYGEKEECEYCGLMPSGHTIDNNDPRPIYGDKATSSITRPRRIGDNGPGGSTIDPRDINDKQGERIGRTHKRNAVKPRFADECLNQLCTLNLGRGVEEAVRFFLEQTMVEHKSEEKVKPLPRNQLRYMNDVDLTYRQRVVVVSLLRLAAKFHYIHAVNEKIIVENWGLSPLHINRCFNRVKSRISRLQVQKLFQLRQRSESKIVRDEKMSNYIAILRKEFVEHGLSKGQTTLIIRQISSSMRIIGEPSDDGQFSSTRIDILVAIIARRTAIILGHKGYQGLIARWIGLSPGGVTGRAKELKTSLDNILGPID